MDVETRGDGAGDADRDADAHARGLADTSQGRGDGRRRDRLRGGGGRRGTPPGRVCRYCHGGGNPPVRAARLPVPIRRDLDARYRIEVRRGPRHDGLFEVPGGLPDEDVVDDDPIAVDDAKRLGRSVRLLRHPPVQRKKNAMFHEDGRYE